MRPLLTQCCRLTRRVHRRLCHLRGQRSAGWKPALPIDGRNYAASLAETP